MLNPTTLTTEELRNRIKDLHDAGMHLAAKALVRELNFREKQAA